MKKILLGATGAFGAIPGLAIIASGIGVPPNAGPFFGGFVEAIGVCLLLLLWINRKQLRRLSKRRLTRWTVGALVIAVGSTICYLFLYDLCAVTHPSYGSVFYPLWLEGDLASAVQRAGGRWQALDRYGTYAIVTEIQKSSSFAWAITIGVFLLAYQSIFSSLTVAFGLLAVREDAALDTPLFNARTKRRIR